MEEVNLTQDIWKKKLLATTLFAGVAGGVWAGAAIAQETDEEEDAAPVVIEEVADDDEARQEKVVVTGSRIGRSEFDSIKPIQVITGDISRDIGLVDAASLLQESTAATGLQIDTTFNGFVLDNGPGASTIDLRGLGASRTLVMINGRRLGAAGVEGAPGVPDLNLIPSSLIDRIDVLLDGASSIYGSDAVAGVANVILRKDFDGFEIEGSWNNPLDEGGGGGNQFVSANWGVSNDRGFMGFGAEWNKQQNLQLNDRPDVFGDCATPYEVTTTGEIRTQDISVNSFNSASEIDCNLAFGINRIWLDPQPGEDAMFGSLYFTPGTTNVGVPNYSDSNVLGFNDILGPDGFLQVDILSPFYQNTGSEQSRGADVQAEVETFSAFTYGEYGLGDDLNTTAFFEAMYSNRQFVQQQDRSIAFRVGVPADNPFNPCNPDGVRGVDCGEAAFNLPVNFFGAPISAFIPFNDPQILGARTVRQEARINLRPEDAVATAEVAQFRMVAGLRGDLALEGIGLDNWTWEASASYDRSTGQSRSTRFSDDRLALSLATTIEDPDNPGQFICGLDTDGDGIPEQGTPFDGGGFNDTPNCIPIDAFSPTIYGLGGGNFATDAEYDYLISNRTFNTIVEQTIFQAYASGDLFELPAGTVAGVIGVEYREDAIESLPDDVARLGLNVGFFSDRGASGSRDFLESFVEVEAPILAGQPLAEELTVNASARWTEESQFGAAWTYAFSGRYRPVDYLTFRGTYGTSFRAPNLQEQFILGQSGFAAVTDPCIVPENAYVDADGDPATPGNVYDRNEDGRSELILQNCINAGVDPTTLGRFTSPSTPEIFTFKGLTLKEETSEAATIGVVFEQPFTDSFDLTTSVTYYDIEIEDTIIQQGRQNVIDDCYVDRPSSESALCGLVRRSASTGFISEVDTPFINQDAEVARGIDFGVLFEKEFAVGATEMNVGLDLDVNYTLERSTTVRAPGAEPVTTDFAGTIYNPEWQGIARAFVDYGDFRVTWNTNWTGEQQALFSDPFSGTGVQTCLGEANGDVDCRDVDYFDDYFLHNASVRYTQDTWTMILGVRNVFDTKPDKADPDEFFEIPGTNIPFGQDFIGRSIFLNARKSF